MRFAGVISSEFGQAVSLFFYGMANSIARSEDRFIPSSPQPKTSDVYGTVLRQTSLVIQGRKSEMIYGKLVQSWPSPRPVPKSQNFHDFVRLNNSI
jgi:hypothetical protein